MKYIPAGVYCFQQSGMRPCPASERQQSLQGWRINLKFYTGINHSNTSKGFETLVAANLNLAKLMQINRLFCEQNVWFTELRLSLLLDSLQILHIYQIDYSISDYIKYWLCPTTTMTAHLVYIWRDFLFTSWFILIWQIVNIYNHLHHVPPLVTLYGNC